MVRENRTLVMRDSNEEKQIISFFVPKTKEYSIQEIRKYLQTKLPTYAVPSILCPIVKMPLTPNGKIDNRRLPYPDAAIIMAQRSQEPSAASDAAELTPMQTRMLAIFEEVLGRPVVLSDNFFDAGGHSILATRLTFQLRVAFKQELPLNLLYQYPTAGALSAAIQGGLDDDLAEIPSEARESAEVIDVAKEVVLPDAIAANGRTYKGQENTQGVFLTGATGFLGAFLAAELLTAYPVSL